MRTRMGTLVIALAAMLPGCTGSTVPSVRTPTAPSLSVAPQPGQPGIIVTGRVTDSALRPLAGAVVKVLDGAEAGIAVTTDAAGAFQLDGQLNDQTRFQASRNGYVTADRTLVPGCLTCPLAFRLAVEGPAVDLAGQYTLTLAAESTCAELPGHLNTRTYQATIAPDTSPDFPANTSFSVLVTGAPFLDDYNQFSIHSAGNYVAFFFQDPRGPVLVEQLPPNGYLGISGVAEASVGTPSPSVITAPFDGFMHYCTLGSPPFSWRSCDEARDHARCQSPNNRLTLTRR